MGLRCREEVHICSSGRPLVKPNHESKRRGKCVHEAVVPFCEMKRLTWESAAWEGTSC
jgi:hypothetical protein